MKILANVLAGIAGATLLFIAIQVVAWSIYIVTGEGRGDE